MTTANEPRRRRSATIGKRVLYAEDLAEIFGRSVRTEQRHLQQLRNLDLDLVGSLPASKGERLFTTWEALRRVYPVMSPLDCKYVSTTEAIAELSNGQNAIVEALRLLAPKEGGCADRLREIVSALTLGDLSDWSEPLPGVD